MKFMKIAAILLPMFMLAENVEIVSNSFEADEMKRISIFEGNVNIKRGSDEINASKVIVYFDENKKPFKYEAIKNVKFLIILNKNKIYSGRAGKIIYLPKKAEYIFEKNVYIHQKPEDRKIYGEKIIINKESGQAKVTGKDSKPVKFIFKIDDNSSKATE
ncbi:lipopolysaccharide transport periplasmic protein LptA [Nitrosophilus alvini]|uniref:lipopolysaccharide transport periplasmic protein LptA n=1 Tax=Nitrosophilus alvini TaxID=2714855 RepID=UPI00190A5A3B|nr:lipopolysaccharide transport periplasmic protein LptA [Nitrosophilus alvini]